VVGDKSASPSWRSRCDRRGGGGGEHEGLRWVGLRAVAGNAHRLGWVVGYPKGRGRFPGWPSPRVIAHPQSPPEAPSATRSHRDGSARFIALANHPPGPLGRIPDVRTPEARPAPPHPGDPPRPGTSRTGHLPTGEPPPAQSRLSWTAAHHVWRHFRAPGTGGSGLSGLETRVGGSEWSRRRLHAACGHVRGKAAVS